ncbi:MAG TPA: hypothetical protein VEB64_01635 [Azospirillaceae bacterium]|nr:hypothetical protein [Azospirillaceae bacterium]
MSASRVKRALSAALLLALLPAPYPAWSQGSPEWRPSAPVLLGPAERFPVRPSAEGRVLISPVQPREIDMLRRDDADSTGALESSDGGLGINLWQDTPRSLVENLLPALPVTAPSPAMQALTRRLLLTTANAPGGGTVAGGLAALRLAKLAELGGVADVDALFRAARGAAQDEAAARAWVEARLLGAEPDCDRVAELAQGFQTAWWRKVRIYCQIRAGAMAEATLAADLQREQGEADDTFFLLVDRLTGHGNGRAAAVKSLPRPAPLTLALMRHAGLPLPPDTLSGAVTPALLAAVARGAPADPMAQVTATERAATTGALRAETVADAYDAFPFKPADIAGAAKATEPSPRHRALVHRAIAAATDPTRRESLIAQHLSLIDPALAVGPVGTVPLIRALDGLAVLPSSAALAPLAARAYYAQGRDDAARLWHDLAFRSGGEEELAALRLWPLAVLATTTPGPSVIDGYGLGMWLDAALKNTDVAARDRVAGILALLEAVGEPVEAEAWMRVMGTPAPAAMPSLPLWFRLRDAAANNRVGETVLVALNLLGNGGPQATPPLVVAQIVAALRAVSLDAEARDLAREAAVGLVW